MTGLTVIGVFALGWALVLVYKNHKHHKDPSRFLVLLMLVAGFSLSGGILGTVVQSAASAATHTTASVTSQALGVAVPLLLGFLAVVWIVHDWRTKKIEAATPWIALATPAMLPVAAGIAAYMGGIAAPAVTTISSMWGG